MVEHMKKKRNHLRWICNVLFLMLLFSSVACSAPWSSSPPQQVVKIPVQLALPGQQIWKQGVSSYLFGTNDTYEWADNNNNIETQPKFQQALRDGGFTLMRSFIRDKSSDEDIETRIQTIEKSGAQCLAVITNVLNTSFDEHLVSYLGNRCLLYEFGNEPDLSDKISFDRYLQQWNKLIPLLRKINPNAKFIGPVTSNDQGNKNPNFMHDFLEGVKASGVLPDAVSFHWYPCDTDSEETCLSKASSYGTVASGVEAQVQAILGKTLPIGITEWNYDPNNPPPSYGDKADFITKFSTAAMSSMIGAGVTFACQFDAGSDAGYGRLDMFDTTNNNIKPQYYAIKSIIDQYKIVNQETQTPTSTP
jgi:Glycosyl hydrolase catalytic core